MRISDWSSDVCSSDLRGGIFGVAHEGRPGLDVVCGGGLAGGLLRSGLFALRLGDLRGLVRLADHRDLAAVAQGALAGHDHAVATLRSEERRVGQGCVRPSRSRWGPYHKTKKTS